MGNIERCWVCPECHWTGFYEAANTHVVCMGEHRDEGLECVEYVPLANARGAVAAIERIRDAFDGYAAAAWESRDDAWENLRNAITAAGGQ